jgi:hypothetical protein
MKSVNYFYDIFQIEYYSIFKRIVRISKFYARFFELVAFNIFYLARNY